MTKYLKSIKYYPQTELILFIIATTLTFIAADYFNLNILIPFLLTLFSYFIFLGGTNLITLTEDKIQISFLNVFDGQASVDLNRIIKVWSTEIFEQEITIDAEAGYYLFSRNYHMEYLDHKGEKKLLSFRISSKKKENEITGRITNVQKKSS